MKRIKTVVRLVAMLIAIAAAVKLVMLVIGWPVWAQTLASTAVTTAALIYLWWVRRVGVNSLYDRQAALALAAMGVVAAAAGVVTVAFMHRYGAQSVASTVVVGTAVVIVVMATNRLVWKPRPPKKTVEEKLRDRFDQR